MYYENSIIIIEYGIGTIDCHLLFSGNYATGHFDALQNNSRTLNHIIYRQILMCTNLFSIIFKIILLLRKNWNKAIWVCHSNFIRNSCGQMFIYPLCKMSVKMIIPSKMRNDLTNYAKYPIMPNIQRFYLLIKFMNAKYATIAQIIIVPIELIAEINWINAIKKSSAETISYYLFTENN